MLAGKENKSFLCDRASVWQEEAGSDPAAFKRTLAGAERASGRVADRAVPLRTRQGPAAGGGSVAPGRASGCQVTLAWGSLRALGWCLY